MSDTLNTAMKHLQSLSVFRLSKDVKNRVDLARYLNENDIVGVGAEIGVWRGYYSEAFLKRWNGKRFYLIDPWAKLDQSEYDDIRNTHFDPADFDEVQRRFVKFRDRVVIHRAKSVDAAMSIRESFDFVYIDANHSYSHVLQDMNVWWEKLSDRAVLAGHDIMAMEHPGVTQAVVEFATMRGLKVDLVYGDYSVDNPHELVVYHSWFIKKGW